MADEQPTSTGERDMVSRLQTIETKLLRCEELRRKQRRVSLIGVLLIILLFIVFGYRIVERLAWYRDALNDPARRSELLTKMLDDSQARQILQREGKILMQDLRKEVLPVLEHTVAVELDKQLPIIQKEVLNLGGRLQEHAEKELQAKLVEALIKSMEKMDTELQQIFGDIKEKELEKQFEANKQLFVDELHTMIEERLAKVQSSLEVLKKQVANMGDEVAKQGITVDNSEALFIDALLELLVYEIKPEFGREPVK